MIPAGIMKIVEEIKFIVLYVCNFITSDNLLCYFHFIYTHLLSLCIMNSDSSSAQEKEGGDVYWALTWHILL
jgi:hypothetical protein